MTQPAFALLESLSKCWQNEFLGLQADACCSARSWQQLAISSCVDSFHAMGAAPCRQKVVSSVGRGEKLHDRRFVL